MDLGWFVVSSFLLKGILSVLQKKQYASIGTDVLMSCPDVNAITWEKLETKTILALCENGKQVINKILTDKMSKSDTCNKLEINNFTQEDVGIYACFTNKKDKGKYIKYEIDVQLRKKPEPEPKGVQAVALNTEIIVQWRADRGGGSPQTFFIEYRKRFESTWIKIDGGNHFRTVIYGLQPETVYFLRMFATSSKGDSNRTEELIVITGNLFSMSTVVVLLCISFSAMMLCWCGTKVIKNRNFFTKDRRSMYVVNRNDEISLRHVALYDEVDSVYNDPAINIRSEHTTTSTPQDTLQIVSNANSEICISNIHHDIGLPVIIPGSKRENETNVLTVSSSEESVIGLGRQYMSLERVEHDEHNYQGGESSVGSSEGSETNVKTAQKN